MPPQLGGKENIRNAVTVLACSLFFLAVLGEVSWEFDMTDPVLDAATAKFEAAYAEMRRWEDFIRMYSELAPQVVVTSNVEKRVEQIKRSAQHGKPIQSVMTTSLGALAQTEALSMQILTENGSPMNTRDLLRALEGRGYSVGGKSPIATLSARLSRSTGLVNTRPQGWWMRNAESAGDEFPAEGASPAFAERQAEYLTEPQAQGREAGPGGGT